MLNGISVLPYISDVTQNKAENLQELVARIMDAKGLSSYDVQRRSKNKIDQSYVVKIKNGQVKNPSDDKKQALADGLGVTFEEVSAAARGVALADSTFEDKLRLAAIGADNWTEEQKNYFLRTVQAVARDIRSEREAGK